MSMKLKGLLLDSYQARLEQGFMGGDTITLKDVPCEMQFKSAQVYMEHETGKHDYLPVFHLVGNITEIHGDFPYHISSLYFDSNDSRKLTKNCLYYPTPEEIAHLVQTGKFFSKYFKIPAILDTNIYTFPAKVDLTIIPPPDAVAYETATYNGGFTAETDLEKLNLPIVYVNIVGSGINRKNDKLLDYYGIDFDSDYEVFALTAESSGYIDPPLMMYISEPEITPEEQRQTEEYYISKEEEAEMLKSKQPVEQQIEAVQNVSAKDYQKPDEETVAIIKADRNINKRIEEKVAEDTKERSEGELEAQNSEEETSKEEVVEEVAEETPVVESEQTNESPDAPESRTDIDVVVGTEDVVAEPDDEDEGDITTDKIDEDMSEDELTDAEIEAMGDIDVNDTRAQQKINMIRNRAIQRDAARAQQEENVKVESRTHDADNEKQSREVPQNIADVAEADKQNAPAADQDFGE